MSSKMPRRLFSPMGQAIFICCLASLLPLYDFFIQVAPGVMIDGLMHSFNRDAASVGLLGAVFYLAYGIFQPPSGYLIDRYGVKNILVIYTLLTAISSMVFALTHSFAMIIAMRLLAGFGFCIAFIACYYLAARLLPHKYFSLAAALLHLAGAVGAILAQAPLSMLVQQWGWRSAMFACGIAGFIIAIVFYLAIHVPKVESHHHQENQDRHFFYSFIKCIGNAQLRWIALSAFLGWLPMSVVGAMWGIPYLSKVYHWPMVKVSSLCSLFWVGSAVGGLLLSFVSEWYQRRKLPLVMSFMVAFICGVMLLQANHFSPSVIGGCLFLMGITVCIQTMSFSLVKENIAPQYFALASGINNFFSMMSGVLGQHLVGALLVYQSPLSTSYTMAHYQKALLIVPLASLLGFIICGLKVRETFCQNVYVK